MSKKKPKTATPPAADTAKPFRLIVHIGAGKTGTTSIQDTLRHSQALLNEQDAIYFGINFENSPAKHFEWQRVSGAEAFHALPPKAGTNQLLKVLRTARAAALERGYKMGIWSSEWLLSRPRSVIPALQEIASEDGTDILVIAYVRRHDAWIRSSYVQWGLKHKTYSGDVVSFSQFRDMRAKTLNFADLLQPWHEAFGKRLMVRNFDVAGDVVIDFVKSIGLDSSKLTLRHSNESPSDEELFLRSMFNKQFGGKVKPLEFSDVLGLKQLHVDTRPDDWLASMLPKPQELEAVRETSLIDRERINKLLQDSGQPPLATSPLSTKEVSVDPAKLVTAISQIVLKQALRIKALEDAKTETPKPIMAPAPSATTLSLHSEPRKAGPAFLISTGRSGSTLIQRLLNCHRDLVVWGEHHGMLNGLAQAYHAMSNVNQTSYPQAPDKNMGPSQLLPTLEDPRAPIEWANPWSLEELRQQLRAFIEGYFASRVDGNRTWGFKEILYNNMPVLRMLHELYPNGRFIFIRRDVREVTRSKVSAFIKESRWAAMTREEKADRVKKLLADVQEHYRIYNIFMDRFPGAGMIVDFEALLERPRDVILTMLKHLELDNAGFDWPLADRVMSSVITKTERDDSVVNLIREVAETMSDVRQPQAKR